MTFEERLNECTSEEERRLAQMYWAGDGVKAWWNRAGKYDCLIIFIIAIFGLSAAHYLLGVSPTMLFNC